MIARRRLAFRPGGYPSGKRELVWLDRSGTPDPLPFDKDWYYTPRASPDERLIAVAVYGSGPEGDEYSQRFIWIYQVDGARRWRLTNEGDATNPTWSRDGEYVYFNWNKNGGSDVWKARIDQSEEPSLVWDSGKTDALWSISSDGRLLAGWAWTGSEPAASWRLTLDDDPIGAEWLTVPDMKASTPALSPDGKHFVFQTSAEGFGYKTVVQEIATGERHIISATDGSRPRWSPTGTEIFYRTVERTNLRTMYAVDVKSEQGLSFGSPRRLFDYYNDGDNSFSVSADGQRFLMIGPIDPPPSHLRVITNWFEELERIMFTGR